MNQLSESVARNPDTGEPLNRLEIVGQLRAQLVDVLPDAETMWNHSLIVSKNSIVFRGHLAMDPSPAFALLRERFVALGFTPLLRSQSGYDVVIALPYVFSGDTAADRGTFSPDTRERSLPRRWQVNAILFLLTVCTTTLMGAVMEQGEQLMENPRLFFQNPWLILTGIPASLTIMGILGVHELAHYFVARRHGLDTTLPYFIPVPFGLGTFGAIIRIRTPWENRKALFDVGLAGPLAGFIVALPLFFIGLMTSPTMAQIPGSTHLGSPLLLQWVEDWVYAIRDIPPDHDIYANAMTFASWFGLIVTGFNLLPVGQLDGGHVAYAVLGRWARAVGVTVLIGLALLGAMVWSGWFVWATFIFLSGWRHPAPLNALDPLGHKRQVIGILVFVLTALLFTPAPYVL